MRDADPGSLDRKVAARLAELRQERGWSLDDLAQRSGTSRSTLSRLERGEISPTASMLGRLATAYERTISRLLAEVEADPTELIRAADQPHWTDVATGFTRRSISPPHPAMRAELIEGLLDEGADIAYEKSPMPGLEHHVWVTQGTLEITVNEQSYHLEPGDCLRYRLFGPSRYRSLGPAPARYTLVVALP